MPVLTDTDSPFAEPERRPATADVQAERFTPLSFAGFAVLMAATGWLAAALLLEAMKRL